MKVAGVVLLATLVIYKDLNGKPFHTSWWGILGLIGWTYAVCAGIYLFTRESLRKNAVAWFAVITLAVISHSGLIPEEYGSRILLLPFIPSDWTLHAFGMSGLLTSLLMQRYANREHPGKFIGMLCILGAGMLILALVSHSYWIISKIQAYALGYKLPGAGGGGYLYIVAKDPGAALQIRKILTLSPPNSNARFVEMSLSNKGLQISRS